MKMCQAGAKGRGIKHTSLKKDLKVKVWKVGRRWLWVYPQENIDGLRTNDLCYLEKDEYKKANKDDIVELPKEKTYVVWVGTNNSIKWAKTVFTKYPRKDRSKGWS